MSERTHAAADQGKAALAAPVAVRSDCAAVTFLQQNAALAATIDAGTIFVHPEFAGSRAVLSHEYAHVAQLRSGLTASRNAAEAAAERVAAGETRNAGGAAPPPLFQKPGAKGGPFTDRASVDKLEQHDLPGARVERKVDARSDGEIARLGSHADVSGSRADGTIVSRTDLELQFFTHAAYADPKQTPSPAVPPDLENVLPPAPGPAQARRYAYPIVIHYRRSIVLTDRAGHDCDLHADCNVYFTYRTWKLQIKGRPLTLELLTSLRGDFGRATGSIASRGLPESKLAGFSNSGASIDEQTAFAQRELSRKFVGRDEPADFLRAPETAGAQYDSLEAFLHAADAPTVAPAKRLPPAAAPAPPRRKLGPAQDEDRTPDDEPHDLPGWLKAIGRALAKIGSGIEAAWDALPWQVRSALKVIAITVASVVAIGLVLLGAAEIIVAGAAAVGVTLAVGTVFGVLVGITIATQFGRSLMRRIDEAKRSGVTNPLRIFAASLADTFGVGDIAQALTNRSLLSNQPLNMTDKERFESGLGGLIQLGMILLGGGKARAEAGAADVSAAGGVTAEPVAPPAEPPVSESGAGEGANAPLPGELPGETPPGPKAPESPEPQEQPSGTSGEPGGPEPGGVPPVEAIEPLAAAKQRVQQRIDEVRALRAQIAREKVALSRGMDALRPKMPAELMPELSESRRARLDPAQRRLHDRWRGSIAKMQELIGESEAAGRHEARLSRLLRDLDRTYADARAYGLDPKLNRTMKAAADGIDQISKQPARSGEISIDHIYPINKIVTLDGYINLVLEDQRAILSYERNLIAMDHGLNLSKQDTSWMSWKEGERFYSEPQRSEMIQREMTMERELQAEIYRLLKIRSRGLGEYAGASAAGEPPQQTPASPEPATQPGGTETRSWPDEFSWPGEEPPAAQGVEAARKTGTGEPATETEETRSWAEPEEDQEDAVQRAYQYVRSIF
jgi:hypothetical protein